MEMFKNQLVRYMKLTDVRVDSLIRQGHIRKIVDPEYKKPKYDSFDADRWIDQNRELYLEWRNKKNHIGDRSKSGSNRAEYNEIYYEDFHGDIPPRYKDIRREPKKLEFDEAEQRNFVEEGKLCETCRAMKNGICRKTRLVIEKDDLTKVGCGRWITRERQDWEVITPEDSEFDLMQEPDCLSTNSKKSRRRRKRESKSCITN